MKGGRISCGREDEEWENEEKEREADTLAEVRTKSGHDLGLRDYKMNMKTIFNIVTIRDVHRFTCDRDHASP